MFLLKSMTLGTLIAYSSFHCCVHDEFVSAPYISPDCFPDNNVAENVFKDIWPDRSQSIYIQGTLDTLPIHKIIIDR